MTETAYSVSELSLMIKNAIQQDPRLKSVTVRGEVSGFRHQVTSGHWYFSLKDEDAVISCVMFYQNTRYAKIRPQDGNSVILTGYVNTYPKSSAYQICVTSLRPSGTGDLYQQFEELKKRLAAEGLFDLSRKKTIPMVPRKVAVVTSGSSAAWQDILNISGSRNPSIPIVLISVLVQGDRAGAEIAAGIRAANERTDADVLIVARGGGSTEDLWCFNEETVARAVADSRIPVVSGVGHETDTTICDLAADIRAATPSNAAEIVFPNRRELGERLNTVRHGLVRSAEGQLTAAGGRIQEYMLRMTNASPERRIMVLVSCCELFRTQLNHGMRLRIETTGNRLAAAGKELEDTTVRRKEAAEAAFLRMKEKLEAVSPLRVLERGYSLVTDRTGKILTGRQQATDAGKITIRFTDGSVDAAVENNGG